MQTKKTVKQRRASDISSDNAFYESMPMSMRDNYVYRDDADDQYRGTDDRLDEDYKATIKRIAIITLIVAAAVALGIGFLFAQGLSLIRDTMPVNQTSSGTLEP
jgi:hypothetical protein